MTEASVRPIRAAAFIWPRGFAEDRHYKALRQSVLEDIDGLILNLPDFTAEPFLGRATVRVRRPTLSELKCIAANRLIHVGKSYLCIEVTSVDYDLAHLKPVMSDGTELTADERENAILHYLQWTLQDFLNKFLTLINICYFGCLNCVFKISYIGRRRFDVGGSCETNIANAYLENEFIKKPVKIEIDPLEALEWSKGCKGFWSGVAESSVEKSIACLTHSFSVSERRNDPFSDLLWSLAGLEALFCDSESGISHQIKKRAPLLVDRFLFSGLDRRISKGYNFRSRLFHGDIPIRSRLISDDFDNYDTHYEYQAEEHSSFFLLLLTCSIVSCIRSTRHEISFKETIFSLH